MGYTWTSVRSANVIPVAPVLPLAQKHRHTGVYLVGPALNLLQHLIGPHGGSPAFPVSHFPRKPPYQPQSPWCPRDIPDATSSAFCLDSSITTLSGFFLPGLLLHPAGPDFRLQANLCQQFLPSGRRRGQHDLISSPSMSHIHVFLLYSIRHKTPAGQNDEKTAACRPMVTATCSSLSSQLIYLQPAPLPAHLPLPYRPMRRRKQWMKSTR